MLCFGLNIESLFQRRQLELHQLIWRESFAIEDLAGKGFWVLWALVLGLDFWGSSTRFLINRFLIKNVKFPLVEIGEIVCWARLSLKHGFRILENGIATE